MALTGRWDRIERIDSDETQLITITYPLELSEDDPNYSKRGTSVEEEVSIGAYETTTFEDVYIMINQFTVFNSTGPDENGEDSKLSRATYKYRVFENSEERVVDFNNPFHEGTGEVNVAGAVSHIEFLYNHLKTLPGFTNLIDA